MVIAFCDHLKKSLGIEILEASSHADLSKILPIRHEGIKASA
jgi:hypothetical protein